MPHIAYTSYRISFKFFKGSIEAIYLCNQWPAGAEIIKIVVDVGPFYKTVSTCVD